MTFAEYQRAFCLSKSEDETKELIEEFTKDKTKSQVSTLFERYLEGLDLVTLKSYNTELINDIIALQNEYDGLIKEAKKAKQAEPSIFETTMYKNVVDHLTPAYYRALEMFLSKETGRKQRIISYSTVITELSFFITDPKAISGTLATINCVKRLVNECRTAGKFKRVGNSPLSEPIPNPTANFAKDVFDHKPINEEFPISAGNRGQITTFLKYCFKDDNDQARKLYYSQSLDEYDRYVWLTLTALFVNGYYRVTLNEILNTMHQGKKTTHNKEARERVLRTLWRLSQCQVMMNNHEEAVNFSFKDFSEPGADTFPLISLRIRIGEKIKTNDQYSADTIIEILGLPVLIKEAYNRGYYENTAHSVLVLSENLTLTKQNIGLHLYLLDRINYRNQSPVIKLETLYKKLNISGGKEKRNITEKAKIVMKHFQDEGRIKEYVFYDNSINFTRKKRNRE